MAYRPTTPAVDTGMTDPGTAQLFLAARSSLGFVPNLYREMARHTPLLETYRHGYARLRSGSFTGPEQEVIFLTVSRRSDCRYCIASHATLATEDFGMTEAQVDALRKGRPLTDRKLEALRAFTEEMLDTNGQPSEAAAKAFLAAGYSEAQMFEVILAIALKTMSNLAGRLSQPKLDPRFAPNG